MERLERKTSVFYDTMARVSGVMSLYLSLGVIGAPADMNLVAEMGGHTQEYRETEKRASRRIRSDYSGQ